MTNAGFPGDLEQRLGDHGFTLVERTTGGPMGSWTFLFTDGVVDVLVFNDRGQQGVEVGVRGGTAFEIKVWLHVLGIGGPASSSVDDQLAWFFHHTEDVRTAIEHDPGIGERLREVKWESVKKRLRLSPEADRNDPSTWRRT